jgi:hypothetical protein
MVTILGLVNCLVFLFISTIHFYWAFGGKWGAKEALPEGLEGKMPLTPSVFMTIVVVIFLSVSIFFGQKAGLFDFELPVLLEKYGLIAIGSVLLIRAIGEFKYVGFFKKIKNTRFGELDSRYYSPLCLVLSINSFQIQYFL